VLPAIRGPNFASQVKSLTGFRPGLVPGANTIIAARCSAKNVPTC
jgi:hypothetical protein